MMSSTRRDFLKSVAGATALAALGMNESLAAAADTESADSTEEEKIYDAVWPQWNPERLPYPQKTILFLDWRHVQCGRLQWYTPDGNALGLYPGGAQGEAYPKPQMIAHGVRLVAQPATKGEPIEGPFPSRIIYENGVYRGWSWRGGHQGQLYYMESEDGFDWKEHGAVFGLSEMTGVRFVSVFGVFKDPNGPPEERYKAVWCGGAASDDVTAALREQFIRVHPRQRNNVMARPGAGINAMYGATSPDGIHDWKFIPEPILIHSGEAETVAYYDEWLDKYVLYSRLYVDDRRVVGRVETSDFRHWPLRMEPVLIPSMEDSFATDIYSQARTEYPGLPQYHLMFPFLYERDTERSIVRLYVSRDGILWDRVPGEPIISPGDPGAWDGEFIWAGGGLVPLGSDRIAIPYGGTRWPHKYPRWGGILGAERNAWASWPKERLSAVVADQQGEFSTFPLLPAGRKLQLNARIRRGGEIRVGLVGPGSVMDIMYDATEIPGRTADDCDSIFGDSLAHPVHWNGETDIGINDGEAVCLRFKMRAAGTDGLTIRAGAHRH